MPSNAILTEEFHVPDKMVGLSKLNSSLSAYSLLWNNYQSLHLVIGRGGEQITRLQAESACKIQMAAGRFDSFYNFVLCYPY